MPNQTEFERCLCLVARLSVEREWHLDTQTIQHYAEQVLACFPEPVTDDKIYLTIGYYHEDHSLVETLRGLTGEERIDAWTEWSNIVLRVLAQRVGGSMVGGDPAVQLDDLMQDALIDIWHGLPTFRYQSHFRTWAITTISHCHLREIRRIKARKRAIHLIQSLDALISTTGDILADEYSATPEQQVDIKELQTIIQRVLAHYPDQRIEILYKLRVDEQLSMRAIGEQLHLSLTRVHALVHMMCDLLKKQLEHEHWIEPVESPRAVDDYARGE